MLSDDMLSNMENIFGAEANPSAPPANNPAVPGRDLRVLMQLV